MSVKLILKHVVQFICLIRCIILILINIHWMHHLLWTIWELNLFSLRIFNNFFLRVILHHLSKRHLACKLVYFSMNFFKWHMFEIHLTWTNFGYLLVQINVLHLHNLLHYLSKSEKYVFLLFSTNTVNLVNWEMWKCWCNYKAQILKVFL